MPTVELGLKHQWFPIAPTGNNMQEHQSMSTKTVEEFMLNGMNVVCAIICSAATLATMPPALSGIHFSPLDLELVEYLTAKYLFTTCEMACII